MNHIFSEKKDGVQKVLTVKSNHDAACLRCDLRAPCGIGGSIRWRRLPAIILRVIISSAFAVFTVCLTCIEECTDAEWGFICEWEKVIFECVGSLRIWTIASYVVRTMVSASAWVLCLAEWGNDSSEGESTCILPCLVFGRFSESIWEVTIFLRGLRSILDPPGHSPVNFEGRRLYSFKHFHDRDLLKMKKQFR